MPRHITGAPRKARTLSLPDEVWRTWLARAQTCDYSVSAWLERVVNAAIAKDLDAPFRVSGTVFAAPPTPAAPPANPPLHAVTRAAAAEFKVGHKKIYRAEGLPPGVIGLDRDGQFVYEVPAAAVAPTQNNSSRTVSSPQPAVFQAPASEGRNPVQEEEDAKIAALFPVPPGYERLPFNCVMIDGMQYALAYHSRAMPPPRAGKYLKAADGNGVVWYLDIYRPDEKDRYQGTEEGCSQGQVWLAEVMDAKFKPDPAFIDNTTDDDALSDDE